MKLCKVPISFVPGPTQRKNMQEKIKQGKILSAKFAGIVFLFFLCGLFTGILNYNSIWLSSAESKDFKSKVIASLQAEPESPLPLRDLIPGEWFEACIFVADTSYPESARAELATLLEQRGLGYADDKKDYPVIFLFLGRDSYKTVRVNQRYIRASGRKYALYFKSEKRSGRRHGCVGFSDAVLIAEDKEKSAALLLASAEH